MRNDDGCCEGGGRALEWMTSFGLIEFIRALNKWSLSKPPFSCLSAGCPTMSVSARTWATGSNILMKALSYCQCQYRLTDLSRLGPTRF